MSKYHYRLGLLFVFACALACGLLVVSCGKKGPTGAQAAMMMMMQEVPVRAVPAVATDVPLEVAGVGNVEAVTTVEVKSRISGQVMRVDFQEGQDVRQGQLLFEIDPEPLLRQIAQIEADLAKDAALEQQSRANVVKDEAMLKQSRAQADRGLVLSKEGIFSKEQTEQVVATAIRRRPRLDADRAAVESARRFLEKRSRAGSIKPSCNSAIQKSRRRLAGRAGAINVKAGNLMKDNDTALVTILQTSPIYVSFGVPEQLLPEVQKYNAEHP